MNASYEDLEKDLVYMRRDRDFHRNRAKDLEKCPDICHGCSSRVKEAEARVAELEAEVAQLRAHYGEEPLRKGDGE
jgi:hypothetical protein